VGRTVIGNPRAAVTSYVARHQIDEGTYPSLAVLMRDMAKQVAQYGSLANFRLPPSATRANDMYLASEAIRNLVKDKASQLTSEDIVQLSAFKGSLDSATTFIPTWLKIAVAIALGHVAHPLRRRAATFATTCAANAS
jgi:PiT family inorganic phosphate transporter